MGASDIIAIIAIVVSVGSVIFQVLWEKKRQRYEKKTILYKEAYKEIFLDEIPIAERKIRYVQGVWCGTNDMVECMRKIRLKSYFFKYVDDHFREQIKGKSQNIEDFLLELEGQKLTNEKYRSKYDELEKKLGELYDTVLPKFY